MKDQFLTLCNLWCEQQVSAEQLVELQTLLRSDRELQRIFVEYSQLHGMLAWDAGVVAGSGLVAGIPEDKAALPAIVSQVAQESHRRKSRYSPRLVATVAVCLLIAGVATTHWNGSSVWQLASGVKQPANVPQPGPNDLPPESTEAGNSPQEVAGNTNPSHLEPLSLNGVQSPEVAVVDPDSGPPTASVSPTAVALDDASIIAEIDRQIAAAWSDNNVIAADVADDHEWVRRCFLTLTGRIPTVTEASTFVDSKSPRKRTELVDSLLEDPRFAENLSVTWTNLLIGRSNARHVDEDALYGFLQRQFLKNRPWMETVGDLIAAEGRSDQNGATNFLLAHLNDQATPATAVTARLFLGQQVQCTQCHDHPFAKERSQDEFWSLNAFFKQAERRPLTVTTTDGKSQNVWTLADTGSPGMTFYDTLRGQQKAVLPEFDGHAMSADDT
ncbi:MAG: DUF1549 domain-containing protein, partial [Fuerstia sp.]|nr:DUF1549 domain-containing protein [Fuerstiella sp.]